MARSKAAAQPKEDSDDDVYTVEKILNHRRTSNGKVLEYHIKWEGYDERTWEPSDSIDDDGPAVQKYWRNLPASLRLDRYKPGSKAYRTAHAEYDAERTGTGGGKPASSSSAGAAAKSRKRAAKEAEEDDEGEDEVADEADEADEGGKRKKKARTAAGRKSNGSSSNGATAESPKKVGSSGSRKRAPRASAGAAAAAAAKKKKEQDTAADEQASGDEDGEGEEEEEEDEGEIDLRELAIDWEEKYGNLKSWEGLVDVIDTIEQHDDADPSLGLKIFIHWNDGSKGWVPSQLARQKCPQKIIDFFEAHLKWKKNEFPVYDAEDKDAEGDVAMQEQENGDKPVDVAAAAPPADAAAAPPAEKAAAPPAADTAAPAKAAAAAASPAKEVAPTEERKVEEVVEAAKEAVLEGEKGPAETVAAEAEEDAQKEKEKEKEKENEEQEKKEGEAAAAAA